MQITFNIGAHEKREVAVSNIPGSFLSTEIEKTVVMVLSVALEDIITLIHPKMYRKYVVLENNTKPLLYVKL